MDTENILLLIAALAIAIGLIIFYKKKEEFRGCTKCRKNEALDIILQLDETSNYILPEATRGYHSYLRRYRCRNCGYEYDDVGQESNGD